MKYYGKIQDDKDLVTKEYVDNHSGVQSVNGKTGTVTLGAGDVGADASGTAQGLINALDFSNPAADGTAIAFIDAVSQENGKISATKKTVRSATTSQTGVVQLNNTTNSTSTTQAATANAVRLAYEHSASTSVTVNGETFTQSAGNINLGTLLRQHQSLAAYRTASAQDAIDAGKLDKTGGTMTGNLDVGSSHIGTNGYIQGTWLQTTQATPLTDSDQIATISNGWIYYVTKATMKSMLGVPAIQYSDTDIGEGAQLATGTFYFVYE